MNNNEPTRLTNKEARDKGYWFISNSSTARLRWKPIAWQGWATLIIFYAIVIVGSINIIPTDLPTSATIGFIVVIFILAYFLNLIAKKKGLINHWG